MSCYGPRRRSPHLLMEFVFKVTDYCNTPNTYTIVNYCEIREENVNSFLTTRCPLSRSRHYLSSLLFFFHSTDEPYG